MWVYFRGLLTSKCKKYSEEMQADCYHGADVQPSRVGLPPDGPQKTVHLLDDADLLVVLGVRVFGDDGHLQAFLRFAHRLHLRVLPQIDAVVLDFFGAVCAYEGVEVSQNLQREGDFRETC